MTRAAPTCSLTGARTGYGSRNGIFAERPARTGGTERAVAAGLPARFDRDAGAPLGHRLAARARLTPTSVPISTTRAICGPRRALASGAGPVDVGLAACDNWPARESAPR